MTSSCTCDLGEVTEGQSPGRTGSSNCDIGM